MATDDYTQAYLAGLRPRQSGDSDYQQSLNRLLSTTEAGAQRSWAADAQNKKINADFGLQGQQIAGQRALAGDKFGYDTSLQGQVGQQQEASDWRHADISTFQQKLKQASDSDLLEQEQWGRIAQQDLAAYYQKQQIDQQAGIQGDRDERQFAHEAAMHETLAKTQMVMEEIRERHADIIDEGHMQQHSREFYAGLNQDEEKIVNADRHQREQEKQQRYSQVEAAFRNGSMVPDPGSWNKGVAMQEEINKIDSREDLMPSEKRQAIAQMIDKQQDLLHRGIPKKPDASQSQLDSIFNSLPPDLQSMYPRGVWTIGPKGPQVAAGYKPPPPAAKAENAEREKQIDDIRKEIGLASKYHSDRDKRYNEIVKEMNAEKWTENNQHVSPDHPRGTQRGGGGFGWWTNPIPATSEDLYNEANKRLESEMPASTYKQPSELLEHLHTLSDGRAGTPPPKPEPSPASGQQTSPQGAPAAPPPQGSAHPSPSGQSSPSPTTHTDQTTGAVYEQQPDGKWKRVK